MFIRKCVIVTFLLFIKPLLTHVPNDLLYYNSKSIFHFFSPNFNYSSHILKKAKISLFKIFCRRCKREIQEDFLQEDEPESRRLRWRAHNAITSPEPIRRHNHHNKRYIYRFSMVNIG